MSCECKICKYHREFKKHLETVPEESKQFFNQLYEYYVMADEEKNYLEIKLDEVKK